MTDQLIVTDQLVMTEQLPIIINIDRELSNQFIKIDSICNKLEAQFNFQTLTANWYGDEENILTITLALETPESFIACHDELQATQFYGKRNSKNDDKGAIKHFSDDVFYTINEVDLQWHCYIALTVSELELLKSQPKLLAGFIQIKLQKVLNLIADEKLLPQI